MDQFEISNSKNEEPVELTARSLYQTNHEDYAAENTDALSLLTVAENSITTTETKTEDQSRVSLTDALNLQKELSSKLSSDGSGSYKYSVDYDKSNREINFEPGFQIKSYKKIETETGYVYSETTDSFGYPSSRIESFSDSSKLEQIFQNGKLLSIKFSPGQSDKENLEFNIKEGKVYFKNQLLTQSFNPKGPKEGQLFIEVESSGQLKAFGRNLHGYIDLSTFDSEGRINTITESSNSLGFQSIRKFDHDTNRVYYYTRTLPNEQGFKASINNIFKANRYDYPLINELMNSTENLKLLSRNLEAQLNSIQKSYPWIEVKTLIKSD